MLVIDERFSMFLLFLNSELGTANFEKIPYIKKCPDGRWHKLYKNTKNHDELVMRHSDIFEIIREILADKRRKELLIDSKNSEYDELEHSLNNLAIKRQKEKLIDSKNIEYDELEYSLNKKR